MVKREGNLNALQIGFGSRDSKEKEKLRTEQKREQFMDGKAAAAKALPKKFVFLLAQVFFFEKEKVLRKSV